MAEQNAAAISEPESDTYIHSVTCIVSTDLISLLLLSECQCVHVFTIVCLFVCVSMCLCSCMCVGVI